MVEETVETYLELPEGCTVGDVKKLAKSKGWQSVLAYLQAQLTLVYLTLGSKADSIETLKYFQGKISVYQEMLELPDIMIKSLQYDEETSEEEKEPKA